MSKKALLAITIATVLSGCSSRPPAPEGVCRPSTRVDIPLTEVATKTSQGKKAIVMPVEVSAPTDYPYVVANAFQHRLEKQVDESGAELVDRSLAKKLKQEIQLAEQSGRYNASGVPIADYAVIAEVTSANLSSSFTDDKYETNDEGESKYIPAECSFTGKVEGLVKVVELPSMNVLKRIEIEGRKFKTYKQDSPDSDCPISILQYRYIMETAAKNAVNRNDDLKNQLAPSGVVEELRQCEEYGAMVRVNMGRNLGITEEQELELSTAEKVELPDGKQVVELYPVAPGTAPEEDVRHGIGASHSWVGIFEEDVVKIQRGDLVEARYHNGCNDLFEPARTICWDLYEMTNGDKS